MSLIKITTSESLTIKKFFSLSQFAKAKKKNTAMYGLELNSEKKFY